MYLNGWMNFHKINKICQTYDIGSDCYLVRGNVVREILLP